MKRKSTPAGFVWARLSSRADVWAVSLALVATLSLQSPVRAQSALWQSQGSSGNIYYGGGNVGIGTSNPSDALVVYSGGGQNGGSFLQIGSNPSYTWQIGRDPAGTYAWGGLVFRNANAGPLIDRMTITPGGNVGIGTTNPQYKLAVSGNIGAQDIIVTNTGWSDYVFRPEYRLQPLSEVDQFIQTNGHLPDVPTEADVREKGVSLGEMQAKLLAKVEELTLHIIRQDKENRALRERLARVEKATGADSAAGAY